MEEAIGGALVLDTTDHSWVADLWAFARRLPMWAAYLFALMLAFRAWYFQYHRREATLVAVAIGSLLFSRVLVLSAPIPDMTVPSDAIYFLLARMLQTAALVTVFVAAIGDRVDPHDWKQQRAKFGMRSAMLLTVYFALAAGFAKSLIGQETIEEYCLVAFKRFELWAVWGMVLGAAILNYPKHRLTSRLLIAAAVLSLISLALNPFVRMWSTRSAGNWYEASMWILGVRLRILDPAAMICLSTAAFAERPPTSGTLRTATRTVGD